MTDGPPLHVHHYIAVFYSRGIGLQRLLAAHDIEQLDAGWEVGPLVDLARPNIELRAMKGTPNAAPVNDLAARDPSSIRTRSGGAR